MRLGIGWKTLVGVAGLLSIGVAGGRAYHRGSGLAVTVVADRMWQNTGIEIEAGQGIVIAARGSWSHGWETGFEPYYDANGFKKLDSTAILPRVWVGTLLGRIGDGPPFPIGDRLGLLSRTDGMLRLTMNDVPGHFGNNRGSLRCWSIPGSAHASGRASPPLLELEPS